MADLMCPDDIYYTKAQIVEMVMAQKPEEAILYWDTPDEARRRCLTCIITRYRDEDGTEYVFDADKQNSIEVRVSTLQQRHGGKGKHELDDGGIGWRDQIMLALTLALGNSKRTRCPIRVYNDGGFSGTYPPDDKVMIREMRQTRAETYRSAFQEMVVDRCEDAQIKADMQAFLDHRVKVISGSGEAESTGDDLKVSQLLFPQPDRSFDEIEAKLLLRFNCHKNFDRFRPALHFLLLDLPVTNAVFAYDVDRLSRDYALSEVMSRRFVNAGVSVYTCTADAGYVTGQDWKDVIMRAVYLGGAADFVRKNMRQILRSHFAALSAGRPISDIPIWLERDRNKKITWKREYIPLVETALRTWMDTANYKGHRQISRAVNAVMQQYNEGIDDPERHLKPKKSESGVFTEATIRYWLHNPMIYGCMQQWGRSWPIAAGENVGAYRSPLLRPEPGENAHPLAMVSAKQWERTMRARISKHPQKRGRTTTNRRALTGLVRCRCGNMMYFHDRSTSVNKRDEWVCHSQPDAKRVFGEKTGLKWHIGFANDQLMNLINGIMTETPGLLHPAQEPDEEIDARYIQLVAQRDLLRTQATERAKTALPGIEETSDAFQGVMRAMLVALGGAHIETQVNRMEAEIHEREHQPQLPSAEEESSFLDLPPARQNEILSRLIKEIRPVQPNGYTDLSGEYVEITKRDGVALAPILCIQSRVMSNGLPKFRLQTYAEWIASLSTPPPTPVKSKEESGGV
ncbi:MAG: hypothetical protein JWN14_1568 [Chthonomonadales bacterium]|nr:hypothetical protein [Chthonomonadales bacterium]